MAPDEQIDIPAFMWFDEGLTKVFDIAAIKKNSELAKSHDNLFHTLLGLMDVETELYQKDMDIAIK
jgi:lipid A ethanolaminephosphotransferase